MGIIGAFIIKNKIRPRILDFSIVRLIIAVLAPIVLPAFLVYLNHLEATGADQNTWFFFFLPITEKIVNLIFPYFLFYGTLMGYLTPLKKFWSMPILVPVSRLSFSLIIGQFIYLIYSAASARNGEFSFLFLLKRGLLPSLSPNLNYLSLLPQPIRLTDSLSLKNRFAPWFLFF